MVFVCTLSDDEAFAQYFRRGSAHTVLVPVGHDDAADLSYNLMLGLDTLPGGDIEYFFCLLQHDGATNEERTIWSGTEVAQLIPKTDRTRIRATLLGFTEKLLNEVRPPRVTMCMYDAHPPDKAVRKFLAIARVFQMCSYKVSTADPYHGRRVWWMELTENQEVI